MTWNPEQIPLMSAMWNEGKSASEIAAAFGTTRCAILGHAFRRRELFPKRDEPDGKGPARARRPRQAKVPAPKPQDKPAEPEFRAEPYSQPKSNAEYDASRLPFAKTLIELGPHECKWAVNQGGPFLFCADASKGRYCPVHMGRAYRER